MKIKEWACKCNYMNTGPICTKCGSSPDSACSYVTTEWRIFRITADGTKIELKTFDDFDIAMKYYESEANRFPPLEHRIYKLFVSWELHEAIGIRPS